MSTKKSTRQSTTKLTRQCCSHSAVTTFSLLLQTHTPTPSRFQTTPLAVTKARQEAELAEAETAAVWAQQLAAALELNQDLEGNITSLRQQNASLKRSAKGLQTFQHTLHGCNHIILSMFRACNASDAVKPWHRWITKPA